MRLKTLWQKLTAVNTSKCVCTQERIVCYLILNINRCLFWWHRRNTMWNLKKKEAILRRAFWLWVGKGQQRSYRWKRWMLKCFINDLKTLRPYCCQYAIICRNTYIPTIRTLISANHFSSYFYLKLNYDKISIDQSYTNNTIVVWDDLFFDKIWRDILPAFILNKG